jgi:hypothetical protein
MIKKLLLSLAFVVIATTSVHAGSIAIEVGNLTTAQVEELKAQAARAIADNSKGIVSSDPVLSLTNAASWGQQAATAAEGFAKALGIAARELGVTVNDFLHTDAGKITALLIIWKIAGAAILKSIYGMFFVTVGLSLARVIYLRLFTKGYEKVQYSRVFGMFTGTRLVRIPKGISDMQDDGEWFILMLVIFITIGTILIGSVFF